MLGAHLRVHTRRTLGAGVVARLTLVLLIVAEVGALVVLVRLGRSTAFDLPLEPDVLSRADPVDALAAVSRWVALIAAAWLLLVTLVAVAASAASIGRRRSGLRVLSFAQVAPSAIRRLVERAVVSGLALGVVTLPSVAFAATQPDPPVVTVVRDGRAGDLTSLPAADASTPDDSPAVATTAPLPANPVAGAGRSVVVAPGEHLWELAAREVAHVRGVTRDDVADDDVAPYWVAVCDANRDRLVSGDVNLVFIGETVVLPPLV